MLSRHPQVKLWEAYQHDTHPHLVTLVEKRKSVIPFDKTEHILSCQACGKPCEGLVWECSECNVNIHQNGYCKSTQEDKSDSVTISDDVTAAKDSSTDSSAAKHSSINSLAAKDSSTDSSTESVSDADVTISADVTAAKDSSTDSPAGGVFNFHYGVMLLRL
ncbi:unnamed protein product [Prunus armeniaca]